MSWRTIVVLGALLAAAVIYLVWLDRPTEPGPATAERLPAIDAAALTALELVTAGARIRVERDEAGGWMLVEPLADRADPRRIDAILSALDGAVVRRVVDERAASLEAYGLDRPTATLRLFEAAGASRTVRLGGRSPVGPERYLGLADDRVVLVDAAVARALGAAPDDFRERRFLPVDPAAIDELLLEAPGGYELSLALEQGSWRMRAPVADRADHRKAEALAEALARLTTLRFVDDEEERRRALASCEAGGAVVRVGSVGGRGHRLELCGAAGAGGERYARSDPPDGLLGVVGDEHARGLRPPVDDYRAREMVSLARDQVEQIEVIVGATTTRLERRDGTWRLQRAGSRRDVPVEAVERLIDRLRELRPVEFREADGEPLRPDLTVIVRGDGGDLGRLAAASAGEDPRAFEVETSWRPRVRALVRSDLLAAMAGDIEAWVAGVAGEQGP